MPGSIGENVTVERRELSVVKPGARLGLGARVAIAITRYMSPCTKITSCFTDGDYSTRALTEGVGRRNDRVMLLPVDARTSDGRA